MNFIKYFNFIKDCVKGIAIGAGAILPGISSGVLCVILGIYEKILDAVLNIFKDFKNNIKFLLPIAIGGVLGVLIFSNILNVLFYKFPIQTGSIFIGLIIGTIPSLLKEVNQKEKFKFRYLSYTIIAFLIGVITVILENNVVISYAENLNFMYLFIAGLIMSIGIIVPGVSSTIILMLMGVYQIYLQSVASLYFPVLIPMGLGLVLGCLIVMKLTKKLLDKYYARTFYAIIGFTLGSIFVLHPTINNFIELVLSVLCVSCGIILTRFFNR